MKRSLRIYQVLLIIAFVIGFTVIIFRLKSSLSSRPDYIPNHIKKSTLNDSIFEDRSLNIDNADNCETEKIRITKSIEEIYSKTRQVRDAYLDLRNDNILWGKFIANWNRAVQAFRNQEIGSPILCAKSSYYENILTHLSQLGIAYANDNEKKIKFHNSKIDENINLTVQSANIERTNFKSKKETVSLPKYKLFDYFCDNNKCVANVNLNSKPDNYLLQRISNKLRSDKQATGRFHVFYYLPGMDNEDMAWARVDFDPEFNVTFLAGNSLDDQQAAEHNGKNISGYIGLWEYYRPKEDFILGLREDQSEGLIMEILKASDPTERSTLNVLRKVNFKGKIKLIDFDQSRGEYFIIKQNGDMEVYDDQGYIQTQKAIKFEGF